jgi:hypothetical protein
MITIVMLRAVRAMRGAAQGAVIPALNFYPDSAPYAVLSLFDQRDPARKTRETYQVYCDDRKIVTWMSTQKKTNKTHRLSPVHQIIDHR